MQKLTVQEVEAFLQKHKRWQLLEGKLYTRVKFKGFKQAFAFMVQVAKLAEEANHHPIWKNSYNLVEITLITTQLNAITSLDCQLAQMIDALLECA